MGELSHCGHAVGRYTLSPVHSNIPLATMMACLTSGSLSNSLKSLNL